MKKSLKIFVIAGEVSGDVLGAKIMHDLPRGTEFRGIGGENMRAAGLRPIFPMSDLAVMGLFEVIANAKRLLSRIDQTVDAIIKYQPDIVLTIDSPSFAKRVIKKVRAKLPETSKIKFYHVVAPQVWAWGAGRAKKFAKIFDRLYSFFDFEVPYFTKYNLVTIPVGHPIADGLINKAGAGKRKDAKKQTVALIPGSRMSEVKKLLPLLRASAEQICHNNPGTWYDFYIPVVETTRDYIADQTRDWCTAPTLVPSDRRYDLFAKTDTAIAASGTVSAELAMMHIPTIVVYKMNAITTFFARFMVKTKWVSLVNILLKKTVYPELLGPNATAGNVVREFERLQRAGERKKMIVELSRADNMWQRDGKSAAKLIANDIVKSI